MKPLTIFKRERNCLKGRLFHLAILLILFVSLGMLSTCTPFARLEGVIVDDRLAQGREWEGVRITREGQQLSTKVNMEVKKGDDIKTDAQSQGVILVSDTWQVIVLPDSEVKILNPSIFQRLGKVIVNTIKKVKEKFKVETEYVTAAAEGTEFLVEVDDEGIITITVLDGIVKIAPKNPSWDPITLENRTAVTIQGENVTPPEQITMARVNEIRQWRINAAQIIQPQVPNLHSFMIGEARDSLQYMGFRVKEKSKITGKVEAGHIYDQNPRPGTRLKVGKTVLLYLEAESVKVPDIVGLPLKEAESILKQMNLRVGKVTKVLRAQGEAETVVFQSEEPGTLVPPGKRLNLQIVQQAVYVPDLTNLDVNVAGSRLQEIGLKTGRIKRELSQGTAETVFKQNPAAGKLEPLGNSVDLWIVEPGVLMPYVTNINIKDALVRLNASQIKIGQKTEIESEDYPEGTVIYQSVPPNKLVKTGSTVDLRVTIKVPPCYLPNVIGRSRMDAEKIVRDAGFSVIIQYAPEEGVNVKDQNPKSGFIKCGSMVTLIVRRIN